MDFSKVNTERLFYKGIYKKKDELKIDSLMTLQPRSDTAGLGEVMNYLDAQLSSPMGSSNKIDVENLDSELDIEVEQALEKAQNLMKFKQDKQFINKVLDAQLRVNEIEQGIIKSLGTNKECTP